MAAGPGTRWTYANHWRMIASFLGVSMALLGTGVLAVSGAGEEAVLGAGVLLAVAAFLVAFSLILFFPRLHRQGSFVFRTTADGSLDETESAVRDALASTGRAVRVETLPSRSDRPPRIVRADGVASGFLLAALSPRERGDGAHQTEVIQVGTEGADDVAAREVRELVGSRLAIGSGREG